MEEESDAPVARLNAAQGKLLLLYHRYRNNVSHTDYSILLTLIFLLLARNLHDPTAITWWSDTLGPVQPCISRLYRDHTEHSISMRGRAGLCAVVMLSRAQLSVMCKAQRGISFLF